MVQLPVRFSNGIENDSGRIGYRFAYLIIRYRTEMVKLTRWLHTHTLIFKCIHAIGMCQQRIFQAIHVDTAVSIAQLNYLN